jgi:hypothetical protein
MVIIYIKLINYLSYSGYKVSSIFNTLFQYWYFTLISSLTIIIIILLAINYCILIEIDYHSIILLIQTKLTVIFFISRAGFRVFRVRSRHELILFNDYISNSYEIYCNWMQRLSYVINNQWLYDLRARFLFISQLFWGPDRPAGRLLKNKSLILI